jgi:archaemetzincin
MDSLSLVPIYLGSQQDLLEDLSARLAHSFGLQARIRPPWFDPEKAFDPSRGQYRSTDLLAHLIDEPPERGTRVLGVAGVDLFIPIFTFVFGEAQLRGRAAVVSVHRLRNELYGLPKNELLFRDRLHKEAVHELGHTHGLIHCETESCVMHSSTYVEEIELKSAEFCPTCINAIRNEGRRSD